MILENLLLTTLFAISSFNVSTQNNYFERKSRLNYLNYLKDGNVLKYNESFVKTLYDYDYFDFTTSISVLTHGMGGNKDYWFPKINGNPSYMDPDSLPYKIISTQSYDLENIPIFTFSPEFSNSDFVDVKIKQLKYDSSNNLSFVDFAFNSIETVRQLFSKHIVLIYDQPFELEENGKTNFEMSSYFSKSLDTVLARVSVLHKGKLPRINMIGHSRGGLLNLHYAYKKEQIVDNFITIGTPYNGSIWANVLNSLNKLGRFFVNNSQFTDNYDGLLNDIDENEDMLESMIDPYKVAIGCEMTGSVFLSEMFDEIENIIDDHTNQITFGNQNIVSNLISEILTYLANNNGASLAVVNGLCNTVANLCSASIGLLNSYEDLNNFFSNLNINLQTEYLEELLTLTINFLNDVLVLFNDIRIFDSQYGCVRGDFCVELDSQLGNSFIYNQFNQKIIIPFGCLGYDDFNDKYLSNAFAPKVIHNYESNHPAVTNQVLNILQTRNSLQHITVENNNTPFSINPYQVPFYNLTSSQIEQFYSPDHAFFGDEFGFRDYYYYESEVQGNPSLLEKTIYVDDLQIVTNRMRTGYIQEERIVLSPNRQNAGLAFIEFYFSQPITALTFDISLWSNNEYINESSLKFVYTFNMDLRDFIFADSSLYWDYYHYPIYSSMTSRGQLAIDSYDSVFESFEMNRINAAQLPTDRYSPQTTSISLPAGFTFVGFYAECFVTSANKNKGRICLSNFGIYK